MTKRCDKMARAKKIKAKQTGIISSAGRFGADNDAHFFLGPTVGMGSIVAKSGIGQVRDAIGRQRNKGSPWAWLKTTISDLQASQNWNESRPNGQMIQSKKKETAAVIEFQMPNLGRCTIGAAFVSNKKSDPLTNVRPSDIPCLVMTLKNDKGKQLTNKQFKHLLEMGTFTELGFRPEFSEVLLAANTIADGGVIKSETYQNDKGLRETKDQKSTTLQRRGSGQLQTIRRSRNVYDRRTGQYKRKPDSLVKPWQRLLDTPLLKKRSWGLYALGSFTNKERNNISYGTKVIWHSDVPDRDYAKLTKVVQDVIETCKSMTQDATEVIPAHIILEWASKEIRQAVPGQKVDTPDGYPTKYQGGMPVYEQSRSKGSLSTSWSNDDGALLRRGNVMKLNELLAKWHPSKTGMLADLIIQHSALVDERDRVKAIDEKFTAEVQALIDKRHEELTEESKDFIKKSAEYQESVDNLIKTEKEDYEKWLSGE
jgi:hypothetical protein